MKLYWKVAAPPTGRYRSFEKRGWPTAYYDKAMTKPAAFLGCEDRYEPSTLEKGDHAPIHITLCHHRHDNAGSSWTLIKTRKQCATLEEAKEAVLKFTEDYPVMRPMNEDENCDTCMFGPVVPGAGCRNNARAAPDLPVHDVPLPGVRICIRWERELPF